MLSAFKILNATRNNKMSWEVDTCLTLPTARFRRPLSSSRLIELSRSILVEAWDIGVVVGGDDIALHLPGASAYAFSGAELPPPKRPQSPETNRPPAKPRSIVDIYK